MKTLFIASAIWITFCTLIAFCNLIHFFIRFFRWRRYTISFYPKKYKEFKASGEFVPGLPTTFVDWRVFDPIENDDKTFSDFKKALSKSSRYYFISFSVTAISIAVLTISMILIQIFK